MEFSEWQKQQQKKSGGSGSRPNNNGKKNQKSYNANNDRKKNQPSYNTNAGNHQRDGGMPYVGAPYNFIPFYDKVYEYPQNKITAHNSTEEHLITGEIAYEVTAGTPIMIDDGTQHFFKDAKGRYAIPGSTMRGLIRNNVQVLGLCGYDDDIDDYALMYRNVASGVEKKRYNNTLGSKQIRVDDGNKSYSLGVLLNVRAGYVANEGGKYVIYQTCIDSIKKEFEGMNYYVLSERKIVNDYLKHGDKFSFGFFRQRGKSILQHEFKEFNPQTDRNGRKHYKGTPNLNYKPYYKPISYEVAHEKDIIAVGNPGQYKNEGYVVSTGKMNEKKAVYIVPEMDTSKDSIPIPEKDVKAFKIDLKKKENTLKQFGGKEYFDLPKEGEMRPAFYIQLDGKLYFGFTPRLRLFYDHMLKEGLKYKKSSIDYSKALFGYASPEKSYKSKLSFSDAVLQESVDFGEEQKLILAEPKPTSYLDYLKQDGNNAVTYNTDNFELRGAKQYWLHKSLVKTEGTVKNEKASSTIYPLKEGSKFMGKIRFQNLTEDELGLLLWSVQLNEGSQMNVGKAKAYGYGRISVCIKEAKKLDLQEAYKSGEVLKLSPFCGIEIESAIDSYKAEINKSLKRPIDELPHIQDFFIMKDSQRIPDDQKTRYMKIDAREYQNRKDSLPTVKTIVTT